MRAVTNIPPSGATYDSPTFTGTVSGNVESVIRSSLPFLRSPSGTMGNNGAFTAGTAFGKTYPKGFMYFAANQIAAGVAAGWYYFTASSTTAFTLFNNTYTSGTPAVPASPTAFVTTGPGATTGDLTEQGILPTIAANLLGASGYWRCAARFTNNNSAGNKTHRIRYSGVAGTQEGGIVNSTSTMAAIEVTVANSMATGAQEGYSMIANSAGSFSSNQASTTVDTTVATNPAITTVLGTSTDWAAIEFWILELMHDGT